jgi:hypothetical protein
MFHVCNAEKNAGTLDEPYSVLLSFWRTAHYPPALAAGKKLSKYNSASVAP